MEAFGVMSPAPLEMVRALPRGRRGAQAQAQGPAERFRRPRTRGRSSRSAAEETETEVAYLKLRALVREGRALTRAKVGAVRVLREEGGTGWGACWSAPAWPVSYYALSHPGSSYQAELWEAAARDILAHGQQVRPQADRHVPARRAGRARQP